LKLQIAQLISRLGHPIILLLVYLFYFLFSVHPPEKATWTLLIIICLGVLPLILWNLIRTRKGLYSNFDVSVRNQRFSMYSFILLLAATVVFALWYSNQPDDVITGSLLLVQLLILAFLLNFKLKVSLHTAIAVFIGFGLWKLNNTYAIITWGSCPFIAWSRWYLQRHLPIELFWGFVLGLLCGLQVVYFT
jgi:hypothetical protein